MERERKEGLTRVRVVVDERVRIVDVRVTGDGGIEEGGEEEEDTAAVAAKRDGKADGKEGDAAAAAEGKEIGEREFETGIGEGEGEVVKEEAEAEDVDEDKVVVV